MSTTIRVSQDTRDRFYKLASETGRPMTQLLDEAIDALERRLFFSDMARRYEQIRNDPVQWEDLQTERAIEDRATTDSST